MSKVIVFGSLNMDLSVAVKRMPHKGETITSSGMLTTPGGKGANQAVMCSRMGAKTHMIGKVGQDAFGRELISSLKRQGVSTKYVTTANGAATGTAIILREPCDNRIIVEPGANHTCCLSDVTAALQELGNRGDFFLTQLECDFDVTMQAIVTAHEMGIHTVCNAAPAMPLTDETYAALDLLCINETEAEALVGFPVDDDDACMRALEFFSEKGVNSTVITLGENGSVTMIGDMLVKIPSYDVDMVDTTGAGDAYLGELVASLVMGGDIIESMAYATAASALAVCKIGAQEAQPTRSEVEEFVAKEGLNA